ncbi:MAG: FixH family protein [Cyclobacteriaceae bacterium]
MKFNWGNGVVVSFVLFMSFIIYVVVQGLQQNIDLVSDTYYLDELAFQDQIEQKSNLANSGLSLELKQNKDEIEILFPESFNEAVGKIHFYHPSRALFDKEYALALNDSNVQKINKDDLIKGHFKVKVNWKVGEKAYYQESEVFIR